MKPHELFRLLGSDEIDALVLRACEDDEIPEKVAGGVLTYQQIPLRRFTKLPEETRKSYVRRTLRDKRAADLALYVLSAALTRTNVAMISAFLDHLGLEHEGPNLAIEGEIVEPPKKKLKSAVDAVLKDFPHRDVALYLHAFAAQPDVHWLSLDERLVSDDALKLEDRSAG
ncbi:MAG: hypothetical protein ABIT01_07655 [Thermoanaerobaculia bacterium]